MLAGLKMAFNPPVVYSTERSKAVVPVLVLFFVALWFILRGDLFYVLHCVILFVFFSPFSIAITSLEEEGACLGAFRTFVRFALVLFPLPLGVWEGLLLMIVALLGLFSYLFFSKESRFKLFCDRSRCIEYLCGNLYFDIRMSAYFNWYFGTTEPMHFKNLERAFFYILKVFVTVNSFA